MGSTAFSILASSAQTATAQGGTIAVAGITEMIVTLDISAVSGTTPQLTFYLQTSPDTPCGSRWFDLPHEGAVILSSGAGGDTTPTGYRNIVTQVSGTLKAVARYRIFGQCIRPAWVISGTTPSFTFQVDAVGK